MSALYQSIDEMLKSVRDEHETTIGQYKDQIFALQTELVLHKSLTAAAALDRDKWMRVATKLIVQFGLVEKVFADAKELALAHTNEVDTGTTQLNNDPSGKPISPQEGDSGTPLPDNPIS